MAISWGQAFRAVIVPAMVVGPLVGLLGAAFVVLNDYGMLFLMELLTESRESFGLFAELALSLTILSAGMGLVIISPICLLIGALGLRLSAVRSVWRHYLSWMGLFVVACLLANTALTLLLLDSFKVALETWFEDAAILVFIGLFMGLLSRWRLAKVIDELCTR